MVLLGLGESQWHLHSPQYLSAAEALQVLMSFQPWRASANSHADLMTAQG